MTRHKHTWGRWRAGETYMPWYSFTVCRTYMIRQCTTCGKAKTSSIPGQWENKR